jgi:hypothetical protein
VRDANDIEKVREYASGMVDRVLAAQQALADLLETNRELVDRNSALEKQIDDAAQFNAHAHEYELVRRHPGAFVYVRKGTSEDQRYAPAYCPHCFGEKKLSIFNPTAQTHQRERMHSCPRCKAEILF